MTITDDYKIFAGRYHPSSSAFSRPLEVRQSVVWCGKHIRFAEESLPEEPIPSLTFCGVTQRDIDEGNDRWVRENARVGTIVKYPRHKCDGSLRQLPHPKWDTFGSLVDKCGGCTLIKQNRVTGIYQCPGHPSE